MRYLIAFAAVVFLSCPALGQQVGDTVAVGNTYLYAEPSVSNEHVGAVNDTLGRVVNTQGDYYKVAFGDNTGWVTSSVISDPRVERFMKRAVKNGYMNLIVGQEFSRNSADGITPVFVFLNISNSKTIKYIWLTLKLYNSVGDPVERLDQVTTEAKGVGPVKPGESSSIAFENVWYTPVGSCVQVERIRVETMDGTTEAYSQNELENIVPYPDDVNLSGDCSYEAQQRREASE